MYINMDNGYAWIELKPASDIGNTFENGVIKVKTIVIYATNTNID